MWKTWYCSRWGDIGDIGIVLLAKVNIYLDGKKRFRLIYFGKKLWALSAAFLSSRTGIVREISEFSQKGFRFP